MVIFKKGRMRMIDTNYLLENNIDEIIAEAKKGREGQ